MLANAAIRLLPDGTVAIQLALFLFVLAVLTACVIRPMIRLVDRRRSFTSEAMESAAKLAAEAEQFEAGRKEMLAMALREAQAAREKRAATARRDADRTIAETRVGVAKLLRHGVDSIESAETLVESDLEELAHTLADEIVERFKA